MKQNILLLSLFLTLVSAEQELDVRLGTWDDLFKYMLAFLFLTWGLMFLLYSPIRTFALMHAYTIRGNSLPGHVLKCEYKSHGVYEILVQYTISNIHVNDQICGEKVFQQLFGVKQIADKGSVVEIVQLPEEAASGVLRDIVEDNLSKHSHLRTIMLVLPGLFLIALIMWLACATAIMLEDNTTAYIVLALGLPSILVIGYFCCNRQWERERDNRFFSAECTKDAFSVPADPSGISEGPLLFAV